MSLALVLAYALAPAAVGPDIAPNPDASLPAEAAPIQTDASEAAPQGEREAASVTLDPLEKLARDWLQRVDARQWQGAFEASAMPGAIDLATFKAAMEKEIVPLGKARKREFLEFGSVKSAGVDYRVARFTTDFANRRGVIETVTMIEGEDGYEVGGYFVDKSKSRPPVSDATLEKAARSWLALVDRSDWQASYDAAGSAFQQPNTVEGWQQASELARVPLGKLIERTAIAFEDVNAPPGGYKIVRFRSDFENRKGVTETVTLEAQQGEWRTVGYFIS